MMEKKFPDHFWKRNLFTMLLIFLLAMGIKPLFAGEEMTVRNFHASPEGDYKRVRTTRDTALAVRDEATVSVQTERRDKKFNVGTDVKAQGKTVFSDELVVKKKKGQGMDPKDPALLMKEPMRAEGGLRIEMRTDDPPIDQNSDGRMWLRKDLA